MKRQPRSMRPEEFFALSAQVAREYDVDHARLLGKSRRHRVAAARWALMRRLRALGLSTTEIGYLCNRDHSTVVYALQRGE